MPGLVAAFPARKIRNVAAYTGFLTGVSTTTTRGQTAAQSMAATVSACGPQTIHRSYANATYTTFLSSDRTIDVDTTNKVSVRTTHVSWNPDLVALQNENTPNAAAQFSGFNPIPLQQYLAGGRTNASLLSGYGTETMANITWLLSIPTYHKVVLNPCHEADGYQSSRTYGTNYGQFRNGFRIICDMVHAFNNPNWYTCLLLTVYAFKANSGTANDPLNFWPAWSGYPATGNNYVDIMGVDVYNEGSLESTAGRWDSAQASIGKPVNSDEGLSYSARYGGTFGWRESDSNGVTWEGGFLGWCEAYNVPRWLVGEIGTIRNIDGVTPSWVTDLQSTNGKNDWIRQFGFLAMNHSMNPAKRSKCFALEYFMSAGRTYAGSDYLSTSIHKTTDGTLWPCTASGTSNSAPPNATDGEVAYATDTMHVYIYQASNQTWNDQGLAIPESWQLWWNDDGSGWDSSSNAGYLGWKDVCAMGAGTYTGNPQITITDNGDGTYTASGAGVVDNGNGTFAMTGQNVTDNGNGTSTAATG